MSIVDIILSLLVAVLITFAGYLEWHKARLTKPQDQDAQKRSQRTQKLLTRVILFDACLAIPVFAFGLWLDWQDNKTIAAMRGKITTATTQTDKLTIDLETANHQIAELTPEPLRVRLRKLFDSISPDILNAIRNGKRGFRGEIPVAKYSDLARLLEEPGASEFVTLEELDDDQDIVAGTEDLGLLVGVKAIIDPAILED